MKTAKDSEQFNLFLSRSGKVGQAPLDTFAVPMVTVRDAALSSGQLTIRRSPLLDVRTTERSGVTRIDLGPLPDLSGGPATEESVLAIRPYEAYHFPTMPFVLRLSAAPIVAEVTAEAQTSVKLDPDRAGPGEQDHLPRRPAEDLSLRDRRARRSPLAGSDAPVGRDLVDRERGAGVPSPAGRGPRRWAAAF